MYEVGAIHSFYMLFIALPPLTQVSRVPMSATCLLVSGVSSPFPMQPNLRIIVPDLACVFPDAHMWSASEKGRARGLHCKVGVSLISHAQDVLMVI